MKTTRRRTLAHTFHSHPLCDASTPAVLFFDLYSGPSLPPLFYRFLTAPMSGGSSFDWWDGWEWRGAWTDSSTPDPTPVTQTTEEQTINAVHGLRDQLKHMTDLTKKRSHRTESKRATSTSKGNDAYAAMEAVIKARAQEEEAKRVYDAKFAEAAIAGRGFSRRHQSHARDNRSTRKTRQDSNNEGGLINVRRSGLLPNTHRAPGRDHPGNSTPLTVIFVCLSPVNVDLTLGSSLS